MRGSANQKGVFMTWDCDHALLPFDHRQHYLVLADPSVETAETGEFTNIKFSAIPPLPFPSSLSSASPLPPALYRLLSMQLVTAARYMTVADLGKGRGGLGGCNTYPLIIILIFSTPPFFFCSFNPPWHTAVSAPA